jgi:TldD protein
MTAKSVEAGKYDLVLDPSHLWLTIHESVGHPLELDRVLGYEANFAGTSFATLDKWKSKNFNYGSKQVNLVCR